MKHYQGDFLNIRKEESLLTTKFIARKYYSSTGAVIEASGDTAQEAKENLKKECFEYNKKPLRPKKDVNGSPMSVRSPGFEMFNTGLSVQMIFNPDRRAAVLEANV